MNEPCDFCGNNEKLDVRHNEFGVFYVECRKCGATGPTQTAERIATSTHELAIEAWDNRASSWIPVSERLPTEDGDYLFRIQQIGGDEWFYSAASRFAGIWDTLISEDNWTHWQSIEAPE